MQEVMTQAPYRYYTDSHLRNIFMEQFVVIDKNTASLLINTTAEDFEINCYCLFTFKMILNQLVFVPFFIKSQPDDSP